MSSVTPTKPEKATQPGFTTSEFWGMAGTVMANVVMVLVAIGIVSATDSEKLTQALTGLATALGGAVTNAAIIWRYIGSRTSVKTAIVEGEARKAEAAVVVATMANAQPLMTAEQTAALRDASTQESLTQRRPRAEAYPTSPPSE